MIAEHVRVAVGGALFVLAVAPRRSSSRDRSSSAPCPGRRPTPTPGRSVSAITASSWRTWPNVNAAQERAQRRGRHHPERQHPLRRPGAQHVGMVDVRTARHDRVPPTSAPCGPDATRRPGRRAAPSRLISVSSPSRTINVADHHQPGVGDQVRVVEGHLDTVERARYCTHRKCLLGSGLMWRREPPSSLVGRHFPRSASSSSGAMSARRRS